MQFTTEFSHLLTHSPEQIERKIVRRVETSKGIHFLELCEVLIGARAAEHADYKLHLV